MIINIQIQNFGSIKEFQTLSFEADSSTHLEDSFVIHHKGFRLLKTALIFGANASGKTTVLNAVEFLRNLALNPEIKKTDVLDFQPYLFDAETPNKTSVLGIEFFHGDIRYAYQVEFSQKFVKAESLHFFNPNKALVFKRETDPEQQLTSIQFGSKIVLDRANEKILEANTLWNNTVIGGFLKTNVEIKELKAVVDWFFHYLNPMIHTHTNLNGFITRKIDSGELPKNTVLSILKKADFHISDIQINKEEQIVNADFVDLLRNKMLLSENDLVKLEQNKSISSLRVEFEHRIKNASYVLPLEMESQGTRRYYGFAGLLALLLTKNTSFSIDELESSLHPDLFIHFLLSFVLNSTNSQIIATTHNREILDNKDLFRNDVIWFTEKSPESATELYSLADFDSSIIRNTTNVLNAYKSGKLRGAPNLSDSYIDLNV